MSRKRSIGSNDRKRKTISLLIRDGNTCHWCKEPFDMRSPKLRPTLEHLKRHADGGSDALHNLVLAHDMCNR